MGNEKAKTAQRDWPDLASQLIRHNPDKRWRHWQVRHAMRSWECFKFATLPDGGAHRADFGVGDEVEEQMTEDMRLDKGLIKRARGVVTSINDDESVDVDWAGLPPCNVRKDCVRL